MCGRFVITSAAEAIAKAFRTTNPLPNLRPRYNAAPTDPLPVVLIDRKTGARRLEVMRWGLIPFWAKDAKIGYSTINAQGETITTKPAFREPFESRRCLVPTDGFFEWQKLDAKTKQPYHIGMADGALFAFAGLWDRWKDRASGELILSFSIVTTTANPLLAPIHERMPVILDEGDQARWLGEDPASPAELQALIRPFPAERMRTYRIGPRVGNVKNDDPEVLLPVAG
jgi:putative SOS response-associated peptidase YedK